MVVRLDAGSDAVRAYVAEQASLGLAHVTSLVRADGDAMREMLQQLSETAAEFKPAPDEFSVVDILRHLNSSFPRSTQRLRALSSGRSFEYEGPRPRPGGIPDDASESFAELRQTFLDGEAEVLAILEAADATVGLDLTADHAEYGPFNWLEWAVYSHHVHTHDHVGHVAELRELAG